MQRIAASALIQKILQPRSTPVFWIILCENPIFKHLIQGPQGNAVKIFSGPQGSHQALSELANSGLFAPPPHVCVQLPDKLAAKVWKDWKQPLSRLPNPLESCFYVLGSPSLKSGVKVEDLPPWAEVFLCYEPTGADLWSCGSKLLHQYPTLAAKGQKEKESLVHMALEAYANDLVSCAIHFRTMEMGKLSFHHALCGAPEVNGFHVAQAIALRNPYLVELRLSQCAQCGEDGGAVLMAIVYFLKQGMHVLGALESTKNLSAAFEKARIPFPAQENLRRLLEFFDTRKAVSFLSMAPTWEREMRLQKHPLRWLGAAIVGWLA